MRFILEIIIAVLAVYGSYTALHEFAALLKKWFLTEKIDKSEKSPKEGSVRRSELNHKRKERRSDRSRRGH